MKYAHVVLIAALAAGLTIGAAAAGQQAPGYNNNYAQTQKHGPKGAHKPNHPNGVLCERGFYGETNCNISPNGRLFGPEAYDYAVGTGQHIQR